MGIVFDEAPAVERPAPMPASSSDDDDDDADAHAAAAPGGGVRGAFAASDPSLSDVSDDDAPAARRGGAALVSQDESAWARALRQAAGEDDEPGPVVPADPPAVSRPAAARKATDAHEGAEPALKTARPLPTPAERKGVAAALERTRLGEGPRGVYFADNAFDWRELAVNPAQQTWSLLGGGEMDAAPEAEAQADFALPAPEVPAAAAPRQTVASAPLAAMNLHTLGASFVRPEGDDSLRSAWEVNREALAVDFKNKRRQALRSGRTSAPKR